MIPGLNPPTTSPLAEKVDATRTIIAFRWFVLPLTLILLVCAGLLQEAEATGGGVVVVASGPGSPFGLGELSVTLNPAEARAKGAGWRVGSSGVFRRSGERIVALVPGAYRLEFKSIPGFSSPPPVTVQVPAGTKVSVSLNYLVGNGKLTVELGPQAALANGAGWRLLGESTFRKSGESVEQNAGKYGIEFEKVPGFGVPPPQTVTVNPSETKSLTVSYPPLPGNPPTTLPNLKLSKAGTVNAAAVQPDGTVIIGGDFTSVNGVPRQNLARINPDGSLADAWNPGADDTVFALLLDGSNLLVGGAFTIIGGISRPALAQLDAATGEAKSDFNAEIAGATDSKLADLSTFATDRQPPGPVQTFVRTMALSSGSLYIGGSFTTVSGVSRKCLAKLRASDSFISASWSPADPNGRVFAIAASDTSVYVGGSFREIGNTARLGVAKLTASGALTDLSWHPFGSLAGGSDHVDFVSALVLDGGDLFLGGDFSVSSHTGMLKVAAVGSGTAVDEWRAGQDGAVEFLALNAGKLYASRYGKIVRFNSSGDGAVDASWSVGNDLVQSNLYKAIAFGSQIIVAGRTIETKPLNSPDSTRQIEAGGLGLARVDADSGMRDQSYAVFIEVPGEVLASARLPDGKIVVGGDFQLANGLSRVNLLRLTESGALDSAWNPGAGAPVRALAASPTGLFVGGAFSSVGSGVRFGLARFDFSTGLLDDSWRWGVTGGVTALAVSGPELFVAGHSGITQNPDSSSIPFPGHAGLAKFDTAGPGTLNPDWKPAMNDPALAASGGLTLTVNSGSVFVGGAFTKIQGKARSGLAKVKTDGAGALDQLWNPMGGIGTNVSALVTDGAKLYVAGSFSKLGGQSRRNLARLSINGKGIADKDWQADADGAVKALAFASGALYVGGEFTQIGPVSRANVARITTSGNRDVVDENWNFSPVTGLAGQRVSTLLPIGDDLFAGGKFLDIAGVPRQGVALLPTFDAPVITQSPDNPSQIVIRRGAGDGAFVRYFQITGVLGGLLFRSDGVTIIQGGDFISAEEGLAGLTFVPDANAGGTPSVKAVAALDENTPGFGAPSRELALISSAIPAIVEFSESRYFVREGALQNGELKAVLTVLKRGVVPVDVSYDTGDATALSGANGFGDYERRGGTLRFSANQSVQTFDVPIADDRLFRGDRVFSVALSSPTGGAILGARSTATVQIVDDDATGSTESANAGIAPMTLGPRTGTLTLDLLPANAAGQWRLLGEAAWRDSGTAGTATGLVTGNYLVEFKPVTGFFAPLTATIAVRTDRLAVPEVYTYTPAGAPISGALKVDIRPLAIATAAEPQRGKWRIQGGNDPWHDSGEVVANLNGGLYAVEFQIVSGYATPPVQLVDVTGTADGDDGSETSTTGIYLIEGTTQGDAPAPLDPNVATSVAPYSFNGQIRSRSGNNLLFGSGVVVSERVVLTAAHVLFDDTIESYVTNIVWMHRKMAGEYEPPQIAPRGWYIFEGYANQRQRDDARNNAGLSTPASQDLDVAALYFVGESPAGGTFGGFRRAANDDNEWLLGSTNKMLVGYPMDGPDPGQRGKMHATVPTNLTFVRTYPAEQVYGTSGIHGFGGNSGGPLYVEDAGAFYPAGIFIVSAGHALVRGIDAPVVDLINRAQTSANGGGNAVGGGITVIQPGVTATDFASSLFVCELGPPAAVAAGAAWRVAGTSEYLRNGASISLPEKTFTIEFKSISGFDLPKDQTVTLVNKPVFTVKATYRPPPQPPVITNKVNTATALIEIKFGLPLAASNSPESFTATPLPPGLQLDAKRGIISGIPTVLGKTTIEVRARNKAGLSAPFFLSVSVLEPKTLVATASPGGTITPANYNGKTKQKPGQLIALTAKALPGFLFTGWTGDKPSASLKNSFKMTDAFSVTANFIENPFPFVQGNFTGLVRSAGGSGPATGVVLITFKSTGSFTGNLELAGTHYPLKGLFSPTGDSHLDATNSRPFSLDLHLDLTDGTGTLTGELLDGTGVRSTFTSLRAPFYERTKNPSPHAGTYTVLLPADPLQADPNYPRGHGSGSVTVAPDGAVTFTGVLGDGTPVSAKSYLSAAGRWSLFIKPYNFGGSIAGEVTFRAQAESDLDGTLVWSKPTEFYPDGFSGIIAVVGAHYALPLFGFERTIITLQGGGVFTDPKSRALPIDQKGRPSIAPNTENFVFTLNKLGTFSGSLIAGPDPKKLYRFSGALFQIAPSRSVGCFVGEQGQTGPVTFTVSP